MLIANLRHPDYTRSEPDYFKWRLTMNSGDVFKNTYLKKFSQREDATDFEDRKCITYVPSFAAAAVTEIVNAIYQRMSSIQRIGGPQTYQDATIGLKGGVDLFGSSMNTFIGQQVIIELLSMRSVGVFVDKPPLKSKLVSDSKNLTPYCYVYKVEDLLSWSCDILENERIFRTILLRNYVDDYDPDTGLIKGTIEQYRQMWTTPEGVFLQLWDDKSTKVGEPILLPGHDRIPFVLFSLNKSLLVDASGYQIALMNLSSSDLAYVLKSNFPFYVEQRDSRVESAYLLQQQIGEDSEVTTPTARSKELRVGATHGRSYDRELDPPSFIHPSPEPLMASMKKQEQMKDELRQLVNLSLASVKATHASAESKGMDDRSLEGGLSAIGLELQHGENQLAKIWASYENDSPAEVKYPTSYTLMSEKTKQDLIKQLAELRDEAPSLTHRKEVCKLISKLTLESSVHIDTLSKIYKEIDAAKYITSNAEDIRNDVEAGLCDPITASNARGYDGEKIVPLAQAAHAERLKLISEAQGGHSNGNDDTTTNTGKDGTVNKSVNPDTSKTTKDPTRGAGK